MQETKNISIKLLLLNTGQIEGLPKNPRFIRDERYEALKKSIEDDPEMLELRELIVYPHDDKYVVIAGNMRLRASKELGFKEMPCKVLDADTPVEKLRKYTIKDNVSFGQDDFDSLANEWDLDELKDCGIELPDFDFDTEEVAEQSFSNSELDTEGYSDKMKITFELTQEEWQFINGILSKIDANKETALLKKLGYEGAY